MRLAVCCGVVSAIVLIGCEAHSPTAAPGRRIEFAEDSLAADSLSSDTTSGALAPAGGSVFLPSSLVLETRGRVVVTLLEDCHDAVNLLTLRIYGPDGGAPVETHDWTFPFNRRCDVGVPSQALVETGPFPAGSLLNLTFTSTWPVGRPRLCSFTGSFPEWEMHFEDFSSCRAQTDIGVRVTVIPVLGRLELNHAPSSVVPVLANGWDAKAPGNAPEGVDVTVTALAEDGEPLAGMEIAVTSEALSGSGGHAHHLDRPTGRFLVGGSELVTAHVTIDETGKAALRYRTSGVAGREILEAVDISGEVEAARDTIVVRLEGLVELAGTPIQLIGETGTHPRNHYGTQSTNVKIDRIAQGFHGDFGPLPVNDMSLEWGGLFDCGQPDSSCPQNDWGPPHRTHKRGIDVDIGVPQDGSPAALWLHRLAREVGGTINRIETSHHHVTF